MFWLVGMLARLLRRAFFGAAEVPPAQPSASNPGSTGVGIRIYSRPAEPKAVRSSPKASFPARNATRAKKKTSVSGLPYQTRQQASDARLAASTIVAATRTPTAKFPAAALPASTADRAIAGLPQRTMDELRRQWLNAINRGNDPQSKRFREALLAEWGRRARHASTPADYFKWPSAHGGGGHGDGDFDNWNQQGILKFLGYQVGATDGLNTSARRHILDAVFSSDLPPVNGPDYVQSWGRSRSPERLRRLAEEIARFLRNAKNKRSANMDVAIDDWDEDLRFLHRTYYVRHFRFAWPR